VVPVTNPQGRTPTRSKVYRHLKLTGHESCELQGTNPIDALPNPPIQELIMPNQERIIIIEELANPPIQERTIHNQEQTIPNERPSTSNQTTVEEESIGETISL
jgi:hypothetical protein